MIRSMLCVAALCWLIVPSVAGAVEVVVTLDGVPASSCNETWTENGVELSFVATEPEDCDGGGNCSFGIGAAAVDLFPARLSLDLTTIPGTVTSAEVDILDFCGVGCTRTFLYQGATIIDSDSNPAGGAQTLLLDAGGNAVDRLGVSSCEGSATEIRLQVTPPAAVPGFSFAGLLVVAGILALIGTYVGKRRGLMIR